QGWHQQQEAMQQQQQQAYEQQQQQQQAAQAAAQTAAQERQIEATQKAQARNEAINSASQSLNTLINMLGMGSNKARGRSSTLENSPGRPNVEMAGVLHDPNEFAKDLSPMMKPDIPPIIKEGISSLGPGGKALVDAYDPAANVKEHIESALALPSLWNGF